MRFDEFCWEPEDIILHDSLREFAKQHSDSIVYIKGDVLKYNTSLPEWRDETPHPLTGFPPKQRIWITGHSDFTIDDSMCIDSCDAIYSVNLESQNKKAHSLPIGLTAASSLESYAEFWRISREPRETMNDVFLSFNIDTHIGHRFIVDTMFREEPWVTQAYPLPINLYYKYIRNHKFVFCPRGNGYDTHRMWETLYLGAIPICVSNPVVDFFAEYLPICVVKSWDRITPEFLELEYERIMSCDTWTMDMLKIGWWQEKILSHVKSECAPA